MGKTTMPRLVREHARRCWPDGLPPNRLEGGDGAPLIDDSVVADSLKALELAMRDGHCDYMAVFEDVGAPGWVHADFEAVVHEDIAGEEIRVHLGNMKYILQFHYLRITLSVLDGDVDRANPDSMKMSLGCLNIDGLPEVEILLIERAIWSEVLRGAGVEDPMIRMSFRCRINAVSYDAGLSDGVGVEGCIKGDMRV